MIKLRVNKAPPAPTFRDSFSFLVRMAFPLSHYGQALILLVNAMSTHPIYPQRGRSMVIDLEDQIDDDEFYEA